MSMADNADGERIVARCLELRIDRVAHQLRRSLDPSSWALTGSPAAGMNVSRVPATTPGSDSGKVTLRKAVSADE